MIQLPVEWTKGEPSNDEKQALYDELANRLSARMLDLAHERLFSQRSNEWVDAYLRSGKGSSFERARIIAETIYASAALVPQVTPAPHQNGVPPRGHRDRARYGHRDEGAAPVIVPALLNHFFRLRQDGLPPTAPMGDVLAT